MKRDTTLSESVLLDHVRRLPHAHASTKQLIREFGVRGPMRDQLEAAIDRLTARGELIELKPGYYVSAAHTREFVSGRLTMHRDGYGFVIPDRSIEGVQGDIYLPPSSASEAMHGDRVLIRITRADSTGRAEGSILKILKRAHTTVVGEFRLVICCFRVDSVLEESASG